MYGMYGAYGMYVPSTVACDARLDAHFNCPDGVENHDDELSGTSEIGENAPNEANFAESMSIVEAQGPIQVTADSGARSRLDKRGGAAKEGQHAAGSCPSRCGWPVNELHRLAPQPGAHGMRGAFSKTQQSRVLRVRK
ncbi:MAG: hypothetical protein ACLQVF_16110 [Isosphaeraceae bacterium]